MVARRLLSECGCQVLIGGRRLARADHDGLFQRPYQSFVKAAYPLHDRFFWIRALHTNAVVARPNGSRTRSFDGAVDLQRAPCLQGKQRIGIRRSRYTFVLSLL